MRQHRIIGMREAFQRRELPRWRGHVAIGLVILGFVLATIVFFGVGYVLGRSAWLILR